MSGKKTPKHTLIEMGCYDPYITYEQIQRICFFAVYHKLNAVSVPLYLVEKVKPYLQTMVKTACLIDFPYGYSTLAVKHHAIIEACRQEAKIIEFTLNNGLIFNKEWDKIHNELKTTADLCKSKNVEFRVAINYRFFEDDYVVDLATSLGYAGVEGILTNTGNLPDDPSDNILLSHKISKMTGITTISSSPFYTKKHYENIKKSKVSGIRINNFNVAKEILGSDGV